MGEYKFKIDFTSKVVEIQIGNEDLSISYPAKDKNKTEEEVIAFAKNKVRDKEEMAMILKALSVWKKA